MNNDNLVSEPKKPGLSSKLVYGLSVLTIIVAAVLVIFGIAGIVNDGNQQKALDEQTKQTQKLVEQVAKQTEDNKKISQQAANYAYCNSVLLAQYTQTLTPIQVQDLNKCVLTSFPDSSVKTSNGTTAQPQSSQNSSTSSSSSAPAQNVSPVTPTSPTQPTAPSPAPSTANPQQSGLQLTLPCVNALGLLTLGCRQ